MIKSDSNVCLGWSGVAKESCDPKLVLHTLHDNISSDLLQDFYVSENIPSSNKREVILSHFFDRMLKLVEIKSIVQHH